MQYEETDWEFGRRMAGRFDTVLIPEITNVYPQFSVGVIHGRSYKIEGNPPYKMGRMLDTYRKKSGTGCRLNQSDCIYFEVKEDAIFQLGDKVTFQKYDLIVMKRSSKLVGGLLETCYTLGKERGFAVARYENPKLAGVMLEGSVVSARGELVRVALDIDDNREESALYSYRYAPVTGSVLYSMPEPGAKVLLYFQSGKDSDAVVSGCVRRTGHALPAPPTKQLETPHGKSMRLSPQNITFRTLTEERENRNLLRVSDGKEIAAVTSRSVQISAEGAIQLYAKNKVLVSALAQLRLEHPAAKEERAYIDICGGVLTLGAKTVRHTGLSQDYPPVDQKIPSAPKRLSAEVVAFVASTVAAGAQPFSMEGIREADAFAGSVTYSEGYRTVVRVLAANTVAGSANTTGAPWVQPAPRPTGSLIYMNGKGPYEAKYDAGSKKLYFTPAAAKTARAYLAGLGLMTNAGTTKSTDSAAKSGSAAGKPASNKNMIITSKTQEKKTNPAPSKTSSGSRIPSDLSTMAIEELAQLLGYSDCFSQWEESEGVAIAVLNTIMKDCGVKLTRIGPNVTVNVNLLGKKSAEDSWWIMKNGQLVKRPMMEVIQESLMLWDTSRRGAPYQNIRVGGVDFVKFGKEGYVSFTVKVGDVKTEPYAETQKKREEGILPWEKTPGFLTYIISNHLTYGNSKRQDTEGETYEIRLSDTSFTQIENWSVADVRYVFLCTHDYGTGTSYDGNNKFSKVIAHEFGHTLGMYDLHNYQPPGQPAAPHSPEVAPGTFFQSGDMMYYDGIVSPNDVEIILEAWKTNKYQYTNTENNFSNRIDSYILVTWQEVVDGKTIRRRVLVPLYAMTGSGKMILDSNGNAIKLFDMVNGKITMLYAWDGKQRLPLFTGDGNYRPLFRYSGSYITGVFSENGALIYNRKLY